LLFSRFLQKNEEEKWDLDMMAAEDGKYFNTIQLIARVI